MTPATDTPVATMLVYRCELRADCTITVETPDAEAEFRRAVDAGRISVVHRCTDGRLARATLVSTGPGRAWVSPERPAEMIAGKR